MQEKTINNRKILFVDHDPKITGSTVSMKYLIKEFDIRGCEVILLSPKGKKALDYFQNCRIKHVYWNYDITLDLHFTNVSKIITPRGLLNFCRLLKKFFKGLILAFNSLKRIKPDLIYINEYVLMQFSIAGKLLNIPSVTHIRSPFLKGTIGLRRYLLSHSLLFFNSFIFAISKHEAQQVLGKNSDKGKKLKIVYEFLDNSDFYNEYDISAVKKDFAIPLEKKVILMIGGIEQVKGTFEIIEAFSRLIIIRDDIYLIIVGPINNNRNYNDKCFNFIHDNDVENSIKIIDFTTRIHELIACSDIVVSSSNISHFSRPTIEAWAQKKAVVSSRTEHALEFMEDGKDCLLFEIGNPESLSEKLQLLLSNDVLRNYLGENGYLKAEEKFQASSCIDRIVQYCFSIFSLQG